MLKKILSLVIISVMVISLFACGGGKEIEMNGSEARTVLGFEYEKCNVEFKDPYNYKSTLASVGADLKVELIYKIDINNEYKNEYKLDKIATIDTNSSKVKGISNISVDRDSLKLVVQPVAFIANNFGNYQVHIRTGNGLNNSEKILYDFDHEPTLPDIEKKISSDAKSKELNNLLNDLLKKEWISNIHIKVKEK